MLQCAIFHNYIKGIGVKAPFCPPYISHEIISIVKEAMEEGLIIENLKTKDWYIRILEKYIAQFRRRGKKIE